MPDSLTRLKDPDAGLRSARKRFEQNVSHLEVIWEQALHDHPDQWVAVYGDRRLAHHADPSELLKQVPAELRGSAVIRFMTRLPRALIL